MISLRVPTCPLRGTFFYACKWTSTSVYVYALALHVCGSPMFPVTTCDLGKGKFSVVMWQLMPFPPPQMALIGHGLAQGQLLGVTASGDREREREREGERERERE